MKHRTTMPPRSTEIRGGAKQKIIGGMAGWLIRLLSLTLRIEFRNLQHLHGKDPLIVIFWHAHIIATIAAWFRKPPRPEGLCALTSASRDGAIIEHALRVNGIDAIRGSSSRRAAAALIELKKTLAEGRDISITPDGPRGPARVLQAGPLKLSQLTECAIIPVRIHYSSAWKLKTWDEFQIPKPFSKILIVLDAPQRIPREVSAEEFETLRLALEKELSQPVTIP
jgi:lysophospholipid acyltransferase (LPLAT)-like uncharacterized protein